MLVFDSLAAVPEYGGGATAAEFEPDERPKSLLKRLGLEFFSSGMVLFEQSCWMMLKSRDMLVS